MSKVNTSLVMRVLKSISRTLDEASECVPTVLNTLIINHHKSLEEGNVFAYLAATQLLTCYIKEHSNQETLNVILDRLIENNTLSKDLLKYDLTSPADFIRAMEDAIIKEMVSGASIGGRMSGLGSNSQVNSTGMAGVDPTLNKKKKKNNKIVNVMNRRL